MISRINPKQFLIELKAHNKHIQLRPKSSTKNNLSKHIIIKMLTKEEKCQQMQADRPQTLELTISKG